MHENWVKVHDAEPTLAKIIVGMLKEHDINAIILNQQDSLYHNFGGAEVYVERDDAVKAKTLIEKFNS